MIRVLLTVLLLGCGQPIEPVDTYTSAPQPGSVYASDPRASLEVGAQQPTTAEQPPTQPTRPDQTLPTAPEQPAPVQPTPIEPEPPEPEPPEPEPPAEPADPNADFQGEITLDHMPYALEFSWPMGGELDYSPARLTYHVGEPTGHLGDDYFGPNHAGDPIYAIADGVVYYVRYVASIGGASNWMDAIMIRHRVQGLDDSDEYVYSFYGHTKARAGLKAGTVIKRREQIAETVVIIPKEGQLTFNPHLHLELRNTVAADQCAGCYPSDKVGRGYSNVAEFGDKDRRQGYYEPSGAPSNRRYYLTDEFIKARLPR